MNTIIFWTPALCVDTTTACPIQYSPKNLYSRMCLGTKRLAPLNLLYSTGTDCSHSELILLLLGRQCTQSGFLVSFCSMNYLWTFVFVLQ